MGYGSWAITGPSLELDSVREEVLDMEHTVDGRDVPIYIGTLEEFADEWGKPFKVSPQGAFITI